MVFIQLDLWEDYSKRSLIFESGSSFVVIVLATGLFARFCFSVTFKNVWKLLEIIHTESYWAVFIADIEINVKLLSNIKHERTFSKCFISWICKYSVVYADSLTRVLAVVDTFRKWFVTINSRFVIPSSRAVSIRMCHDWSSTASVVCFWTCAITEEPVTMTTRL